MNFYTHITQAGNYLFLREVVNGERINRKIRYSPTLFSPVVKDTSWKTLEGRNVKPIKFQTIREAKEYTNQVFTKADLINRLLNEVLKDEG